MIGKLFKLEIPANRIYGLDILRAMAILFVVFAHGSYLLRKVLTIDSINILVLDGVAIFFVLSGYLIGGILIKQFNQGSANPTGLSRFWIRRWFRTLPNYFLVLAILVTYQVSTSDLRLADVGSYFLFLQNFASKHPRFFPEAWSISIEEWFYLLIPTALLLLVTLELELRRALLALITGIVLASIAWRYWRFSSMDVSSIFVWDAQFRKQVVTQMDSLIYGVFCAYLSYYHNPAWQRFRLPLFVLGLVMLAAHRFSMFHQVSYLQQYGLYYSVFSSVLISVGTALLLPLLANLRGDHGLFYRFFSYISLISYSMYLLHFSLVQRILVPWAGSLLPNMPDPWLSVSHYLLYWTITLALSTLLCKYFELPMMRLRERFGR